MKNIKTPLKVTLIIVSLSLSLSSCSWLKSTFDGSTALKPLNRYKVSDFKFTKPIPYFEINSYSVFPRGKGLHQLPALGGVRPRKPFFDQIAYNKLNTDEKRRMTIVGSATIPKNDYLAVRIAPSMSINQGQIASISNFNYLDTQSKPHVIATTAKLMDLLGEIDTPAEIQLILWMNDKKQANSFKKVNGRYEIHTHYYNSVDHVQRCGTFTYRTLMDTNGKIMEQKLIKFKKPTADDECSPV